MRPPYWGAGDSERVLVFFSFASAFACRLLIFPGDRASLVGPLMLLSCSCGCFNSCSILGSSSWWGSCAMRCVAFEIPIRCQFVASGYSCLVPVWALGNCASGRVVSLPVVIIAVANARPKNRKTSSIFCCRSSSILPAKTAQKA